jgi:RimJ/RimL family protein N-acetyltransferase
MILPEIETARLKLRSYAESDIPELVRLAGAREVAATTLRIAHPYNEQHAREFLVMAQDSDKAWFAIALRDSGQFCGGVGLRIEPEHSHAELGYWIGVPFWGNGYATEAAQAAVRYGFQDLQLRRIAAAVSTGNAASEKILVKLGMHHEGHLREHHCKWGKFIDVELYGILREEWDSR